MLANDNPCLRCGACCAYFRVSFYWGEADPAQNGTVPPEITEELTDFTRCMRGTNQKQPRCVALCGVIGDQVYCTIYENRASSCREFGLQFGKGITVLAAADLARCNAARAAWHLPPLLETIASQPDDPGAGGLTTPHAA